MGKFRMSLSIDLDKALWFRRKIVKSGNGYFVSIPRKDMNIAGLNKGDYVIVVLESG